MLDRFDYTYFVGGLFCFWGESLGDWVRMGNKVSSITVGKGGGWVVRVKEVLIPWFAIREPNLLQNRKRIDSGEVMPILAILWYRFW